MDLQNVSAILKDLVAQSIVFSSHLRKFSPLILEDVSSDDEEGFISEDSD